MAKKRATSKEVAERADVSRTTVSLVLNRVRGTNIPEETRQRVLEVARELNYHPTRTVGLVLCQSPDRIFADAFLPDVLRGLSNRLERQDFRVIVHSVEDVSAPEAYIGLAEEKQIAGIILSGPRSDDQQLPRLHEGGFPIVLLGQLRDSSVPFVDVDNKEGARRAVSHLIGLGHRRIAHITNAPLQYTASEDRWRGYQAALADAGIAYDPDLVRYGDFLQESGYRAMVELLDLRPLPTAAFIASDLVAFGAMVAIKQRGLRIPDDIAIVAFDDVRLAHHIDPPLTTVRLPAYDLGWNAGDMLLKIIYGLDVPEPHILLPTELVVRESCGARRLAPHRNN
ncbi:MAG: LacI family DNA-binding transcriptional regulator [Chloroflexi bacterium]|nr:LacI family DNA-binding transcriptional regulator [Chloroflexota bacterium]